MNRFTIEVANMYIELLDHLCDLEEEQRYLSNLEDIYGDKYCPEQIEIGQAIKTYTLAVNSYEALGRAIEFSV